MFPSIHVYSFLKESHRCLTVRGDILDTCGTNWQFQIMIPQDRETLLSFIFSFNNVHDFLLILSPHFSIVFSSLENHPKMDGCVFFPIPQRVERDTKAFQGCLLHSHFFLSSMLYYWSLMFVDFLKMTKLVFLGVLDFVQRGFVRQLN